MKVAIFSDIHANLTAFEAVKEHCLTKYGKDLLIIHLGDCIDYGMRPNEVIYELYDLYPNMIGNIKGNLLLYLLLLLMDALINCNTAKAVS